MAATGATAGEGPDIAAGDARFGPAAIGGAADGGAAAGGGFLISSSAVRACVAAACASAICGALVGGDFACSAAVAASDTVSAGWFSVRRWKVGAFGVAT